MPSPLRRAEPLVGGQLGKLRAHQPAQNLGAFFVGARMRQLADIALDARDAPLLGDRTDIMQHDAGDRGRVRGAQQHGENAAARAANEHRRPNAARDQHADDVASSTMQL